MAGKERRSDEIGWDRLCRIGIFLLCAFTAGLSIGCSGDGDNAAGGEAEIADPNWYRSVVFMEIFPRSYSDSDGDGIGDIPGLTSRLSYLSDLGIGGVWLTPIYPTPFADSGYDVADYMSINPDYGTMDDFLGFLDQAHDLGIRVFLDGVFNHTSSEHPWFVESRSSRDNPKRDWYIWADEPLFDCDDPFSPGFGEERWTYDQDTDQYYFHHFRRQMPDLNHENPEVRGAIKDVARFWLDLGVDGFRLDVAHLYYQDQDYCAHHPSTHLFLGELRAVFDEYGDRAMVGEVAGLPDQLVAYLGDGSDELHMFFNFDLTYAMYPSFYLRTPLFTALAMTATYEQFPSGGQQAIPLGSHDFYRSYGLLLRDEKLCKMASALQLTLPGAPFIYYGEEIGMANGGEVVVDYRDAARTPMHWDSSENAGFTTGVPWIRMASNYSTNNVQDEDMDPESLLNHYRRLIHLRNRSRALSEGDFMMVRTDPSNAYSYFRSVEGDSVLAVLNFSKCEVLFSIDLRDTPWHGGTGDIVDLYSGASFAELTEGNLSAYPVVLPGFGFALLELVPGSGDQ